MSNKILTLNVSLFALLLLINTGNKVAVTFGPDNAKPRSSMVCNEYGRNGNSINRIESVIKSHLSVPFFLDHCITNHCRGMQVLLSPSHAH